jgi:NAD+ synthase
MGFDKLDPLLYAWENGVPVPEVSRVMSLTEEQVKRAFRDFTAKANATRHLHGAPRTLVDTPLALNHKVSRD